MEKIEIWYPQISEYQPQVLSLHICNIPYNYSTEHVNEMPNI